MIRGSLSGLCLRLILGAGCKDGYGFIKTSELAKLRADLLKAQLELRLAKLETPSDRFRISKDLVTLKVSENAPFAVVFVGHGIPHTQSLSTSLTPGPTRLMTWEESTFTRSVKRPLCRPQHHVPMTNSGRMTLF
jgi:hypothetical protein